MTIAALAMWSIWVLAFVVGFSGHPMFSGLSPPGRIGAERARAIRSWPSRCCGPSQDWRLVPVVFVNLVSWLRSQAGA